MTHQFSITLNEELSAQIRHAAAGNISAWMAEAAAERLARETWQSYNATADAIGLNDQSWMNQMVAARETAR